MNSGMTLEQRRILGATPVDFVIQRLLAHIVISLVEEQRATLLADHVAKAGDVCKEANKWGDIIQ